tara:strand:- start:353 stop:2023 length:1671 start_codon:yes stop_codon:yes gene_type:complete
MKQIVLFIFLSCCLVGCKSKNDNSKTVATTESTAVQTPFIWEAANIYFLLTDRFNNGDTSNDINFERTEDTAILRGFEGGDITGITQKIEDGYFTELGINAIWFTPVVEQVHGLVNEGTGATYGYHGYWTRDWTSLDPNFGTYEELQKLVTIAHKNGIRIVMDVVLNHTGPVTSIDNFWGEEWARQEPQCTYDSYDATTICTLVRNLPDIKTESDAVVELPQFLIDKWKKEGRYETEIEELNTFFANSGLTKTPRNYIIKWLTDYIRDLGIDAFRVDTVKHVDEESWSVLRTQADSAFETWKQNNPELVLDDNAFFMLGEVYNYNIGSGRTYDFGSKKVDYFAHGFDNLINFQFKYDATGDYEAMFATYDSILNNQLKDKSILNYSTSHDDGQPFDKDRSKALETGTKLLLTPGLSQVYYGDEIARNLTIENAEGDATLRSMMPWEDLNNAATKDILEHWQKLGRFRRDHPAIGAGRHNMLQAKPYLFSRTYNKNNVEDYVIVGLDLAEGEKTISIPQTFGDGVLLRDAYSNTEATVKDGKISINTPYTIVLFEKK